MADVPKIKSDVMLNFRQRIHKHTHTQMHIKYSKWNIIANYKILKPATTKNTLESHAKTHTVRQTHVTRKNTHSQTDTWT